MVLTSNPAVVGQVTDDRDVAGFVGRFSGGVNTEFVDLAAQLGADGRFQLTQQELETIYGGALPDGVLSLELAAMDGSGNISQPMVLTFELDTHDPNVIVQLAEGSDSGISGTDGITNADPVVVSVDTEVGSEIVLTFGWSGGGRADGH